MANMLELLPKLPPKKLDWIYHMVLACRAIEKNKGNHTYNMDYNINYKKNYLAELALCDKEEVLAAAKFWLHHGGEENKKWRRELLKVLNG